MHFEGYLNGIPGIFYAYGVIRFPQIVCEKSNQKLPCYWAKSIKWEKKTGMESEHMSINISVWK